MSQQGLFRIYMKIKHQRQKLNDWDIFIISTSCIRCSTYFCETASTLTNCYPKFHDFCYFYFYVNIFFYYSSNLFLNFVMRNAIRELILSNNCFKKKLKKEQHICLLFSLYRHNIVEIFENIL